MCKAILLILLFVVSSSAMAEWIMVKSTEENTVYTNQDAIHKAGSMVKMSWLIDHKKMVSVNGNRFMSAIAQQEFNCEEEQVRDIAFTLHSEHMGKGNLVRAASLHGRWLPTPFDDGVIGSQWKIACGKK